MSINVLVVDDHEVVRSGLACLFRGTDIEVVGEAVDGNDAVEKALQHKPDVVLMDIRMPEMDGLAALEKLQSDAPGTPVVMLSTYDNPTYVARGVALGAVDYVLKGSPREMIVEAIHNAARGGKQPDGSIMSRVKGTMAKRHDAKNSEFPLTNREMQVLRHLALGLSNREIGRSLSISIETVKEHVQNILRKVDVTDRTQAAVWAVRQGLV